MKITLSESESKELKENGLIVITRFKEIEICINPDSNYESGYDIQVVNPYDRVIVK